MSNSPRDNFYQDCPAIMNYGIMTDHRQSQRREQYIMAINGLTDHNNYRAFLQNNGQQIIDGEWKFLKQEFSCHPNENKCIHTYPTRPAPGTFNEEMRKHNAVRAKQQPPTECEKFNDYRLN